MDWGKIAMFNCTTTATFSQVLLSSLHRYQSKKYILRISRLKWQLFENIVYENKLKIWIQKFRTRFRRGGGGVKGTSGNYTPDCFTFSNRKSLGDFPDAFFSRLRFSELHCLCNKGAHRNAIFNMYVQCWRVTYLDRRTWIRISKSGVLKVSYLWG